MGPRSESNLRHARGRHEHMDADYYKHPVLNDLHLLHKIHGAQVPRGGAPHRRPHTQLVLRFLLRSLPAIRRWNARHCNRHQPHPVLPVLRADARAELGLNQQLRLW